MLLYAHIYAQQNYISGGTYYVYIMLCYALFDTCFIYIQRAAARPLLPDTLSRHRSYPYDVMMPRAAEPPPLWRRKRRVVAMFVTRREEAFSPLAAPIMAPRQLRHAHIRCCSYGVAAGAHRALRDAMSSSITPRSGCYVTPTIRQRHAWPLPVRHVACHCRHTLPPLISCCRCCWRCHTRRWLRYTRLPCRRLS